MTSQSALSKSWKFAVIIGVCLVTFFAFQTSDDWKQHESFSSWACENQASQLRNVSEQLVVAKQQTQWMTTTIHDLSTITQTIPAVTQTQTVTATITIVAKPDYLSDEDVNYVTDWNRESFEISYTEKLKTEDFALLDHVISSYPESMQRKKVFESLYGISGDRTWLQHVESLPDEGLFPMTKFAQKVIDAHQNPAKCEGKRFFKYSVASLDGMGSAIHKTAEYLGYAMYHDRILIYDPALPPLRGFVDPDTCENSNPFKCLFQELSSCQAWANEENTDVFIEGDGKPEIPEDKLARFPKPHGLTHPIIGQAMKMLHGDISPNALKISVRAQATAYISRLRHNVLERITELRLNTSLSTGSTGLEQAPFQVPFPLPAHTWSLHVRHGDKKWDMKLVPFDAYVGAAELYSRHNPLSMRKWSFVSSEDPDVFEEMHNITSLSDSTTTSNPQWHWMMSDIQRINSGPFQQLQAFQNRTETSISWLSQALMAIECEGFVGTRSSNWNRYIDELRGVWVPAAKSPYLEVGREKDWKQYGS